MSDQHGRLDQPAAATTAGALGAWAQPRRQPLPAGPVDCRLRRRRSLTGASRGEVWWTTNSPCTASVATSRRRSRTMAASGSGHRMYQASSQVLVTAIASSAQPEAAIQS